MTKCNQAQTVDREETAVDRQITGSRGDLSMDKADEGDTKKIGWRFRVVDHRSKRVP
jgi:hypothetical protein